jgi:hypothetical protein
MKVGIIQSNYIPWRGYFDFIDDVDLFIYLDDVQYTRRDWRNRNKIKTAQGLLWLTVPVNFSRDNQQVNIEDIKIDYSQDWVSDHIKTIQHAYAKAKYFKQYADELFVLLRHRYQTISELNININKWIMEKLEIKTQIRLSRHYRVSGTKADRILSLLTSAGATTYLSGPNAINYIRIEDFKENNIGLEYKMYQYTEYLQLHSKYEPNVSVVDLLFNCGPEARKYLKSLAQNKKVL